MDTKKIFEEYVGKIQPRIFRSGPSLRQCTKRPGITCPAGTRGRWLLQAFPFLHRAGGRVPALRRGRAMPISIWEQSDVHDPRPCPSKIVEAVTEQIRKTSAVSAPVENQFKLGKIICDRLPSADKVRFCNSGTEATMGAIRLAREYRKRYKVVKVEGGYHGSHDIAEISVKPPIEKAGPIDRPKSVPEDESIPPKVVSDCIIIPFNQPEVASQIISENHDDLAAVIVEPVLGSAGMVPSDPDFLRALREVTAKHKVPLIFDEVYTFRLSKGGYQEIHNIIPDITALGKIIGGGYPVGGIAGREEFMDLFNPMNPSFLGPLGHV